MRVVPGNEGTLVLGNASELAGIVLDMGMRRFVFNDCKAFEGEEDLKLELTLAKNGPCGPADGGRRSPTK